MPSDLGRSAGGAAHFLLPDQGNSYRPATRAAGPRGGRVAATDEGPGVRRPGREARPGSARSAGTPPSTRRRRSARGGRRRRSPRRRSGASSPARELPFGRAPRRPGGAVLPMRQTRRDARRSARCMDRAWWGAGERRRHSGQASVWVMVSSFVRARGAGDRRPGARRSPARVGGVARGGAAERCARPRRFTWWASREPGFAPGRQETRRRRPR